MARQLGNPEPREALNVIVGAATHRSHGRNLPGEWLCQAMAAIAAMPSPVSIRLSSGMSRIVSAARVPQVRRHFRCSSLS